MKKAKCWQRRNGSRTYSLLLAISILAL